MSGLEIRHKQQLHLFRWFMLLVLVGALGVYGFYGLRWYRTGEPSPVPLPFAIADASVEQAKVTREDLQSHTVAPAEPRFLLLDDFLISARVQKAGLDERKMFTMPTNLDDVVWYEKSAVPGSGVGAVIISGRNVGIERDGTFSKLRQLAKQDVIKIERGDGEIIRYEVRSIQEETLEDVNKTGMTQMMTSLDPAKEGLSLITDSGNWIPSQKEFDKRIIVRAVAK